MEQNISKLMEIIEKEAEVLEVLSDSLFRQKEAAVQGDVEILDRITDSQNRALARLNELDKMRAEYTLPIAQYYDVDAEELTMSVLRNLLKDELEEPGLRLLDSIKPLAEKIKHSSKMNVAIIKRCLNLGDERLKRMLEFRNQSDMYSLGGKKTKSGKSSGVVLNREA
ncbi:MAG: flagellar export chaperone FlgN [FCB group bacterium]|nr:flagellar export chaperone FlgN [FCB group bacterium]